MKGSSDRSDRSRQFATSAHLDSNASVISFCGQGTQGSIAANDESPTNRKYDYRRKGFGLGRNTNRGESARPAISHSLPGRHSCIQAKCQHGPEAALESIANPEVHKAEAGPPSDSFINPAARGHHRMLRRRLRRCTLVRSLRQTWSTSGDGKGRRHHQTDDILFFRFLASANPPPFPFASDGAEAEGIS